MSLEQEKENAEFAALTISHLITFGLILRHPLFSQQAAAAKLCRAELARRIPSIPEKT